MKTITFAVLFAVLVASTISPLVHAAPSKRESFENTYDLSNSFYGNTWTGQTFTTDNIQAHTVTSVKISMRRSDASTLLYAYIYATSGGVPTGAYLAKSNAYNTTPILGTEAWGELTFSTPPVLEKNTLYALCVQNTGDSTHKIIWTYCLDNEYSGGTWLGSSNAGVSWTATSSIDRKFQIWGEDATAVYTITSSTTGLGYCWVDGSDVETPFTETWTIGDTHTIYAYSTRDIYEDVERRAFYSWSDEGDQNHTITVTIGNKTITALYHTEFKHVLDADTISGADVLKYNGTDVESPYTTPWVRSGATFSIFGYLFPEGNDGYIFEDWNGDASNPRLWTVSPTTSANYTATYAELPYETGGGGATSSAFWLVALVVGVVIGLAAGSKGL